MTDNVSTIDIVFLPRWGLLVTTTFDRVRGRMELRKTDFLSLDAQGSELPIMKGG
jgi:hypothetical protein